MRQWLRFVISVCVWLLALQPRSAVGGTGAGNEFEHFINHEFDFHVAAPKDWECSGCEGSSFRSLRSENEVEWLFRAAGTDTWLHVTFITNFPAASERELKDEIERRYPQDRWYPHARADGAFVGYGNSPQGAAANAASEYYLVAKYMVIRLDWQKEAVHPNRAVELDLIKASIDRISSPMKIKSIKADTQSVLKPGDRVCWMIEVDDLRSQFNHESLRKFEIKSVPEHFSFKVIDWVASKNWFRVCQSVPTSADTDGLKVTRLSISDDVREIECREDDEGKGLRCHSYRQPLQDYIVSYNAPRVSNATPDVQGPEILGLDFDRRNLTVVIDAADATGLHMAAVHTSVEDSVVVYPEELSSRHPVRLHSVNRPGWNTITQIVVYDKNGLPTVLRLSATSGQRAKDGNAYYEVVDWGGKIRQSNIPVVSWLQERK